MHDVTVTVSFKDIVKVLHCANGDGHFDGQTRLYTFSHYQSVCHKNGDVDNSNPKFNLYLMKINLPS